MKKNGMPNCMICDEGHRTHRHCFASNYYKHECPLCRNKNMINCKSRAGYSYAPRKGGKRQSKKFTKKNRSHKRRRSLKRRRSNKRRK